MRMLRVLLVIIVVVAAAGCEKAPLLAPTSSTITVTAASRVLPFNGSTEVTATVLESGGTPVQNGTVVRFSTNLGSVNPVEVETRNGIAVTTFSAGSASGTADVRATSGGATGGSSNTNTISITIGAAAINTVTLRASPGNVPPNGGSVTLIASLVTDAGRGVEGVPVTFNTDAGTLSSTTATSDANGEARTTLTTSQQTVVSATAGTKTSSNLTITVRTGPSVTISCAPTSGTGNCSAVQAGSNNTATVVFTVAKGSTSSNLRTASVDFGDGTSQDLGTLASSTTLSKTYSGPSSSTPRSFTAIVRATDINGETTSATTTVTVTQAAQRTPINAALSASCGTATVQGQRCEFTASHTGGGEGGTGNAAIQSYTWNFGDDSSEVTTSGPVTSRIYTSDGRRTVVVTLTTADGRTANARTEIIIDVP
ncbi:MAG: PKD domain-containing protein [Acidimicrobiia bacterium]|nr:PKD domain-containing protein [Acidimicrobiia bacterium]